ncbi:hypothetical protein AB0M32_41685 [Streptomyces sp. NPDC051985]
MPHTSFTYLLDEEGRYVTYFSDTATAEDLVDTPAGPAQGVSE